MVDAVNAAKKAAPKKPAASKLTSWEQAEQALLSSMREAAVAYGEATSPAAPDLALLGPPPDYGSISAPPARERFSSALGTPTYALSSKLEVFSVCTQRPRGTQPP